MKLLVIGSGGREHALVWKLAQSPHVTQMWCAPGNAGITEERLSKNQSLVESAAIGAEDLPRLLAFAHDRKAELTVVGPDNPIGESCYYPDSKKWIVRSPERRLIRSEALDYYDGEE